MTTFQTYPIQCSCTNLVDVNIYQSVNVTVDPSLLDKVKKRKINNYKCSSCGEKSELAHHFLFVDMAKKIWVWCYPDNRRQNRSTIEREIKNGSGLISNIIGQEPFLVFGYDELLEKINY